VDAPFVLLDVTPLEDLTAYRRPSGVYTQGRYLGTDDLQALRTAGRTEA
jgi:hypothetical protein